MIKIILSGAVGAEIMPGAIRRELSLANGKPVEFQINSPGGAVFVGKEIIDLIRNYPGETTARVTGLAASMASAICCAADRLIVSSQSVFMAHRASGGGYGDRSDLRKIAEVLEKIDQQLSQLYSQKCGKPEAEILELMENELWLFGSEILDFGFADEMTAGTGSTTSRAAAMADGKDRFHAAFRPPTALEIAAFAGGSAEDNRVQELLSWVRADPENSEVKRIVEEGIKSGATAETLHAKLKRAVMSSGGTLAGDDAEAARLAGMTPAEYRKYSK